MTATGVMEARPGHRSIRVGPDGRPWIEGYRCGECGAATPEPTMACRRCACRAAPEGYRASQSGALYSWTIVERSYPGVAVPFVSVIVDLDDGLTLKGTLKGVEPAALRPGFPVSLVFDDAGGARAQDGAPYIGFHFIPRGDAR